MVVRMWLWVVGYQSVNFHNFRRPPRGPKWYRQILPSALITTCDKLAAPSCLMASGARRNASRNVGSLERFSGESMTTRLLMLNKSLKGLLTGGSRYDIGRSPLWCRAGGGPGCEANYWLISLYIFGDTYPNDFALSSMSAWTWLRVALWTLSASHWAEIRTRSLP